MKFFFNQLGKVRKTAIAILFACTLSLTSFGVAVMAKAEGGLQNIVAPDTGFNAVAHYEFKNEANLGEDSLGNYDLIAKNVAVDPINGGIALSNNGLLYAPALDEVTENNYTDFSDLIKGSYSVSFRAYLRSNAEGGNYLVSTGSYGSHFSIDWAYSGLGYSFGNKQSKDFMNTSENGDGTAMLDGTFSWYRINTVYNEKDLTVTVTATKEGDDSYSFSMTHTLTAASTFGGNTQYSFTIGAQSHLGEWDAGHASTEVDATVIYPNISDFRIYSGVIDKAEIAKIAKYDADNLAAAEAPTYEYRPLAAWDFADSTNAGKDTNGNVDLILKSTDTANYELADGVLTLKNNNILYAGDFGGGEDISDKLSAFTIMLDVKTAAFGTNSEYDIVSSASYAAGFRLSRCGTQLRIYCGGGNGENKLYVDNFFPSDETWKRILVTGDTSTGYIAVYTVNENQAALAGSYTASPLTFGTELCLTFGGWSKFGANDWAYSNPFLKNIRLYDFQMTSAQAVQLLQEGKVETTATVVKEVKSVTTQVEVSSEATEAQILATDGLPESVQVVNEANNVLTANIIWNKCEKGDFSAKLTGFIYGAGVNNLNNLKVELTVNYQFSDADLQTLTPIVWYEFNDADNIGKDSMGNYDLVAGGITSYMTHNAQEGYVSFEKPAEGDGAYLYAPAMQGATTDWSDLITGSYTVSITVNSDNGGGGDRYLLSASCYGNGFLIYGCYDGYDVFYSNGAEGGGTCHVQYATGNYKDKWVTLTATYDAQTKVASFYIDGTLFDARVIEGYTGFANLGLYTFALGAQCDVNGSSAAQFMEGSISDVKVYDFALSARNVKDLIANAGTENALISVPNYHTVEEVSVDTSEIDLVLSSDNTIEDVLAGIPTTVTVKNSKNETETRPVYWLGNDNGLISGYVQNTSSANIKGLQAQVRLSYLVDTAQVSNGQVTEIAVDGVAYEGGPLQTGSDRTLTFKVSANAGYQVASVAVNGNKVVADDGVYTAVINNYTVITAIVTAEEYTITYVLNNGEENATETYVYGDTVELDTYFTKEGYEFAGWYANEDLSGEEVTSIDTTNPCDITLYAKWNKVVQGDPSQPETPVEEDDGKKGGCGGSLTGSFIGALVLVGAAFVAVKARRKN